MATDKTTAVVTPIARLSYPALFEPRKNDLNGKDEYSAVLLFKKGEDLTPLKKAAEAALVKKFGPKEDWPSGIRLPFRDQGERKKNGALPDGYEEGAIFINTKSKDQPGVVDQRVQKIMDPTEVYAGCWVHAKLNAYAYDTKGNRGVAFGLVNVQKALDDQPLGSRTTPEMDFKPLEGAEESSLDDLM